MTFDNNKSIFLQIADLICENILRKQWKEDDRIPSVRDFAVSLEVNPNTVNRTYTYLQDKNIIYNQRGIGYFVSNGGYNKVQEIMKEDFLKNEMPNFIKKMDLLKISIDQFNDYYKQGEKNDNK